MGEEQLVDEAREILLREGIDFEETAGLVDDFFREGCLCRKVRADAAAGFSPRVLVSCDVNARANLREFFGDHGRQRGNLSLPKDGLHCSSDEPKGELHTRCAAYRGEGQRE